MELDDLDPADILAFTTEELQSCFAKANTPLEKDSAILDYLERWEGDPMFAKVKAVRANFETDLDWFNVNHPLTANGLYGKLVVLDFFTYCCINCMHVFPELKALEERFPIEEGLVVIGVHSPKFENEKHSVNILSAIRRYNITHPIVNDPMCTLWKTLNIKCWPTLFVISPDGAPLLMLMGEGHSVFMEKFTEQALKYFGQKVKIKYFKILMPLPANVTPVSKLKFAGKITCLHTPKAEVDDGSQRFAIADSGNNRILIIDEHGTVLYRIGGYDGGFINGDFVTARFRAPQGVAFVSNSVLVVADTENHAIREVTLSTQQVKTLVGTGKQGTDRVGGKTGTLQEISSPWDVAVLKTVDMDTPLQREKHNLPEKTIILIAMAGTHQIWGYFPEGIIWWKYKKIEPLTCLSLIGSGIEENRNNSYPQNAALAQPSGLALAQNYLFIADSESSSVRKASIVDGKVMPVVGGDRNPLNLFAFGDVDGKQYDAKLQHPLGLAYNHANNKIYVADTYNHKIKCIDIETNTIETCCVKDATEPQKPYQFSEPAGLCCDSTGKKLLVADTNNHRIQIIDLSTMLTHSLSLDFSQVRLRTQSSTETKTELRRHLSLHDCKELKINVNVTLQDSFKFTPGAPQIWNCNSSTFALRKGEQKPSGELQKGVCKLQLQRVESEVDSTSTERIQLNFVLNLCDANSCVVRRFSMILENSDYENTSEESVREEINLCISKSGIKLS